MDNHELGRKVLDVIGARPETLNMHTYGRTRISYFPGDDLCGTVACLAGHAMLLSGYSLHGSMFLAPDGRKIAREAEEARELLGMSVAESGVFLQFEDGPERFREMVEAAEKKAADEGNML